MKKTIPFPQDVLTNISGAFVGWITESMHSVFIKMISEKEIEILFFLKNAPSKLDRIIIDREIMLEIKIDTPMYKISWKEMILETDLADYIQNEKPDLENSTILFSKYDFREHDLEE